MCDASPAVSVGGRARRRPVWPWGALLLLGAAWPAPAQDWYVAASLGAASISAGPVTLNEGGRAVEYAPVTWDGRSLESPVYYGLRVGRETPAWWRLCLEAEFTHLKAYADVRSAATAGSGGTREPMSDVVQAFSMSHGLNLLVGNLVLRQPVGAERGTSRVQLTLRAGLGLAVPHAESTLRGRRREGYEVTGPVYQAGAGVEWRLPRRVVVLADYKWTRVSPTVGGAAGTLSTTLHAHHVNLGAGLRF